MIESNVYDLEDNCIQNCHLARYIIRLVYGDARKGGSSVVTFWCPDTLSLVSFAGMTLDKCAVFRIGTLTGCPPVQRKSPLVQTKEPYGN